jgi:hypothetical protein
MQTVTPAAEAVLKANLRQDDDEWGQPAATAPANMALSLGLVVESAAHERCRKVALPHPTHGRGAM